MLLSRSCEYGLRAMLHLAGEPAGSYTPIRTVSGTLGIPYAFLAKITQALGSAGLLQAVRGPAGGVTLARPAAEISLKEVVVALDGGAIFTECVLGLPGCGERRPCPLHAEWAATRARVHDMFEGATLAEVASRVRSEGFRLRALVPSSDAAA
jgi:Rrf2 family transcriptional regulator, iron-sulfur cluster assembly transcription factor